MPLPLEKSDLLIGKINALLNSEVINELMLKQIELEARELIKTDVASANLVLGMVSALKNNKSGVIQHHTQALKLGLDKFVGNQNLATSLSNMGYVTEALEYARCAYEIEKPPSIIIELIGLSYRCSRFDETLKFISELEKLNIPLPNNLPPKISIEALSSFMKRHKLNDKDLASLSSITEKITLKDKLKISSFTSNIYNENGDEWLSIELEINASPKIIASLNITLAEELVKSNVADLLLDKTSYRFIPGQKKMANNA